MQAGNRTYFVDVKINRLGEPYLTICVVGAYGNTPLHDRPHDRTYHYHTPLHDRPHHCHAPAGMDDWRCFMGTCNDCFAGVCDLFAGAYDCFVGAYCHTPLHDRPHDRTYHCHAPGGMGGMNG